MKYRENVEALKKFIEKYRVYDFLVGLNIEFDHIRVQILGKEDLPFLNEPISMVRAKESKRGVMLETLTVEGSPMMSNGGNNRSLNLEQPPHSEKGRPNLPKT